MATITRNVGDITPTQFVRSGVQDDSAAAMAGGMFNAALIYDRNKQMAAVREELTDLRTNYEVNAEVLKNFETPGDMAPAADAQDVQATTSEIQRLQAAREQGLNFDTYRMRAESIIRAAMARRPGLANDYRRLAGEVLGVEVAGAKAEFIAGLERSEAQREANAAQAALEAANKTAEAQRKELRDAGIWIPADADNQTISAAYNTPRNMEIMTERVRRTAEAQQAEQLLSIQEKGLQLTAPQRGQALAGLASAEIQNIAAGFGNSVTNWNTLTDEQVVQQAVTQRANLLRRRTELMGGAIGGSLDNDVRDDALKELDSMIEFFGRIADGKVTAEAGQNLATIAANQFQARLARTAPEVKAVMDVARYTGISSFYEDVTSSNPDFKARAAAAILGAQSVVTQNARPQTAAASFIIRETIANLPKHVREGTSNENTVQLLTTYAGAFASNPNAHNPAEWTGARGEQGVLLTLYETKDVIKNNTTPEQRTQLVRNIAASHARHYREITRSLAGKLSVEARGYVVLDSSSARPFSFKPDTPETIRTQYAEIVRQQNDLVRNGLAFSTIATIGGIDEDKAIAEFRNALAAPANTNSQATQAPATRVDNTPEANTAAANAVNNLLLRRGVQ